MIQSTVYELQIGFDEFTENISQDYGKRSFLQVSILSIVSIRFLLIAKIT